MGTPIRIIIAVGLAFVIFPVLGLGIYFIRNHRAPIQGASLSSAVFYSLGPAISAMVFDVLVGLPIGFYLCFSKSRLARVLAVSVRLPLGVPPLVAGIMLLVSFGPYSPVGRFFHGQLTNTFIAIFIAQSFTALPFVVEGARGAFGSVDIEAQVVADSLLMRPSRRLIQIYIPLSWSAIRSAITLAFLRAFGEFGAVLLVAYSPASLPIYTYVSFEGTGLASTVAPIVVTLVTTSVIAASIVNLPWPGRTIAWLYQTKLLKAVDAGLKSNKSEILYRPGKSAITINGRLGSFEIDVRLDIEPGCTVLLGPSGAGKTVTLHAISHHPQAGVKVQIEGDLSNACQSAIGYVPQKLGLWPHLRVIENLKLSKVLSGSQVDLRQLLIRLDLVSIADRFPDSLSGGQYQRASLARAMATSSRIGILDEPLSALDTHVRLIHRRLISGDVADAFEYLLVVTHDVLEALFLAKYLVIMASGKVLQQGRVEEVITAPVSQEVARILGANCELTIGSGQGASSEITGHSVSFFAADVRFSAVETHTALNSYNLGVYRIESVKQFPWRAEVGLTNTNSTFTVDVDPGVLLDFAIDTLVMVSVPVRRCYVF